MRRRTDRLYIRAPGQREREALEFVRAQPGITVQELADAMGVGMKRAWQYIDRVELHTVWRNGAPAQRSGPR